MRRVSSLFGGRRARLAPACPIGPLSFLIDDLEDQFASLGRSVLPTTHLPAPTRVRQHGGEPRTADLAMRLARLLRPA